MTGVFTPSGSVVSEPVTSEPVTSKPVTSKQWQAPLLSRLQHLRPQRAPELEPVAAGRLTRVVGMTLEAVGLKVQLGQQCEISVSGDRRLEAEVVGFSDHKVFLMPIQNIEGVQPGARVTPLSSHLGMRVGPGLLGRVINGLGQPLDGDASWGGEEYLEFAPHTINPLKRHPIEKPLDVGVRAINALLTLGQGQRVGLFAGSGVGKSVLLGMMTKFTTADIVVVGLIGERGREVKEFIEHNLGAEGLARSVVVASPADDPPLMRLRASQLATRIAEYYRDKGQNVLLLMDSLTRYAQAQREIALATGEPPATKGYPPSVFAKLPQLVERAGNADRGGGSITAVYTVLTEGDDLQDPIADSARAILDGHIVLSRSLAEEGQYPAIDVEASISRVMPNIVAKPHLGMAQRFKQLLALYRQNRDLISIGAYTAGADKDIDQAIAMRPHLRNYLSQGINESVPFPDSLNTLQRLFNGDAGASQGQASTKADASAPVIPRAGAGIGTAGERPANKAARASAPLARAHNRQK
ncbi:flagellar protein export ATPase FliI [Marinibactrum halimedae]|uniref:Flagellum-specific ATP synthase n=1 Tax=Marinibactrum halimedae TaxID=1444977 RepID=A0AA37TCA5_9GAMM|nr:flagellar protein export ATPase FliI [Marinibactrum halimedae]MCD9458849.1 flagellar protein export ATPase FliI [Marinibactrum halimedae]GLS27701.1 flagellum-specific ATP synthase [Marinibactrum halimedae]